MQEQMKNKILYTDEARCDLDSIWDYIALDLQNQQAAERLVNKIMDRVDQLEDFVYCQNDATGEGRRILLF